MKFSRLLLIAFEAGKFGRLLYQELQREEPQRVDEALGELRAAKRLDEVTDTLSKLKASTRGS